MESNQVPSNSELLCAESTREIVRQVPDHCLIFVYSETQGLGNCYPVPISISLNNLSQIPAKFRCLLVSICHNFPEILTENEFSV